MTNTSKAVGLLAWGSLVLGGCAMAPTNPTASEAMPAQLVGLPRKAHFTAAELAGTWSGTYHCAQGASRLKLTLAPISANEVDGVFEFIGLQQAAAGVQGAYRMSGEVSAGQVILKAGPWLRQPPGYITVGLQGWLFGNASRLAGRVLGPACRTFDLERVANVPSAAVPIGGR